MRPEVVWIFGPKEKSLAPAGTQSPRRPAVRLVAVLTAYLDVRGVCHDLVQNLVWGTQDQEN
jgi:hypothetical protein